MANGEKLSSVSLVKISEDVPGHPDPLSRRSGAHPIHNLEQCLEVIAFRPATLFDF